MELGHRVPRQPEGESDTRDMTNGSNQALSATGDDIVVFGPFQLNRTRFELLNDGAPISVGSRAIAILIALTRSAGEILSNRRLLREVWQNTVVEESTVRVHVALLRKVLRDADPDNEYVQNVTGRGYRFIVPLARPDELEASNPGSLPSVAKLPIRAGQRRNNLPQRITPIIGREQVICALAEKLTGQRFVTIVGPGGGGKTTVAIGVAQAVAERRPNGVCFVDLTSIGEPRLVANAFASALGFAPLAVDPIHDLLARLSSQSLLLILDNCEHLIDATARLAERVLQSAPGVCILATSREPLRADGESVFELPPLAVLPEQAPHTREELLKCPAIQLFLQRAEACTEAQVEDEDLRQVAHICRRLEGNPLAIEIIAAHMRLLGLRMLSAGLDDHLFLSIDGRRTAEARHRSLRATLDWSYGLLTPAEQATFRRLSVFTGPFDLDCAIEVLADAELTDAAVLESLVSLARKSLVCADTRGGAVSYRLLDLPRAYARERLLASGEQEIVSHRHARMWCSSGALQLEAHVRQGAECVSVFSERIEDLRAACRWSFSSSGCSLATKLTLTSLWFQVVLAAESSGEPAWAKLYAYILRGAEGSLLSGLEDILESSRRWVEAPVLELTVLQQIARGHSESKTAFWSLWFERVIKRDYRIAINLANAARECNPQTSAHDTALVDRMLAVAYHYAGDQVLACRHAQFAIEARQAASSSASSDALLRCHTRSVLARALWLRGFSDQALEAAHLSIAEAECSGNPRLLCTMLLIAVAVAMWCGNALLTEQTLERLREQATIHSLEYHQLWADCLLTIRATPAGLQEIEPLQLSVDPLTSSQYLDVLGSLREELVSTDAIARTEAGRGGWCTSEILRVKAERLVRANGHAAHACAEVLLHRALETARHQGARAWELRTAMSLARLWQEQARADHARVLLSTVYARFTEGFETADLKAARELIRKLAAHDK